MVSAVADRQAAAEEKEVGREVEAVVARLVACVERGSLPMLRRVGEEAATRMGRTYGAEGP